MRPLTFTSDHLGRDYPELLDDVRRFGSTVRPRGELVVEATPFILDLYDPLNCVVKRPGVSRAFMYMEIAQLLAGTYDGEAYSRYSASAAGMLNEPGAYGPRVRQQLRVAVNELRKDSDSGRAVVYVGRGDDLYYADSHGMPCTCLWQFFVRDGALDMIVTMRSWDLVWGLTYDVPCFVSVQAVIAASLGLPIGRYYHVAGSGHVYERHFDLTATPTDASLPNLAVSPPVNSTYKVDALEWTRTVATNALLVEKLVPAQYAPITPEWDAVVETWARSRKDLAGATD